MPTKKQQARNARWLAATKHLLRHGLTFAAALQVVIQDDIRYKTLAAVLAFAIPFLQRFEDTTDKEFGNIK